MIGKILDSIRMTELREHDGGEIIMEAYNSGAFFTEILEENPSL
jgi:hypothetical protein